MTMINDNFALTGALTIAVNDEVVQETHNLVVTAGKNWVADRMNNVNTVMTHMAVGTGSTAAAAGDTALGTQLDRNTLSSTTVTDNAIEYACTWAAGDGTGALTEAGIFDAASGGDMLARTVFSVVNKGASDSMTITWTITVS
jgi:mannitol-specific phosphotransferase system IIBC component